MLVKIGKWFLIILALKVAAIIIIAPLSPDPRRNIKTREKLFCKYNPNVVFIGTSRTLYGIDPLLFDSLNQHTTRSYNFGLLGLSGGLALQIAEDIILNDPKIKCIFIELGTLKYNTILITPANIMQDVTFRTNVLASSSSIPVSEKVSGFLLALNTTLFQMFSISPEIVAIKKYLRPNNDPVEGKPNLLENGHQSVAVSLTGTNYKLLENENATNQVRIKNPSAAPNDYYISQVKNVINLAKAHGKEVVFYLPNNISRSELPVLLQIASFIPKENLIGLPEDERKAALFKPENLFDAHHLNQKGAAIYTTFFHEESVKKRHNL